MSNRPRKVPTFAQFVVAGAAVVTTISIIATSAAAGVPEELPGAVKGNSALEAFYAEREFEPIWAARGRAAKKRRKALIASLEAAAQHGLPADRYKSAQLLQSFKKARSDEDRAAVEVAFSNAYLTYARDVQVGLLTPMRIDSNIQRRPAKFKAVESLRGVAGSSKASAWMAALPPQSAQYARLLEERARLGVEYRPGADASRIEALTVAMERERWLPRDLGARHVLVNQPEFVARIVDNGQVAFETKSVIGKSIRDQQTPEFSDEMEHMVINPSWYVPRSIATKEYLPKLQSDADASNYLIMSDDGGNVVDRATVDFSQYTEEDFPYSFRQAPGASNALGKVKFMFPNKNNIYLHDTPAKSLFGREKRAFSHGCIRLHQPAEFAYELLSVQQDGEEEFFQSKLNSGMETQVDLVKHVPVHLIYRTAYVVPGSDEVSYFDDVYGRDAKIWKALSKEGVQVGIAEGAVQKSRSGSGLKNSLKGIFGGNSRDRDPAASTEGR